MKFRAKRYPCLAVLALAGLLACGAAWAAETITEGAACTTGTSAADWDTIWNCPSGTWARAAIKGATPSASNDLATKAYVDAAGGGSWQMQEFTASGTFTLPVGVTSVSILAVGGGGGGGGTSNSNGGNGAGGGGGGAKVWAPNVPVSANLTVTIGPGGNGGAAGANNGSDGTSTTVAQGGTTLVTAVYGSGGLADSPAGGTYGAEGGAGTSPGGRSGGTYTVFSSHGQPGLGGGGGAGGAWIADEYAYPAGSGGGCTNEMLGSSKPGAQGLAVSSQSPGGGGGASWGNGGTGGSGAASCAGGSAAANSGGGGGGAGRNNSGNCAGGNGGSGYVRIYYQN